MKVFPALVSSMTNFTGMSRTVIVVVVLVFEGSVPICVKLIAAPVRSTKLPFHCVRLVAGTCDGSVLVACRGPTLYIGLNEPGFTTGRFGSVTVLAMPGSATVAASRDDAARCFFISSNSR